MAVIGQTKRNVKNEFFATHQFQEPYQAARRPFRGNYHPDFGVWQRVYLMAGDWLKIEVCTPDKPEVIGIADMLGIAPAHAFGSLFMVWRWFDQHTTEGNASYVTKVTIDRLSGNAGFADAMAKVGWLIIHEDGSVALPHFDRHNGETAKQRGLTAKRVAKNKSKNNAKSNADSVTKALPREEKRREDIKPLTPTELLSALGVPDQIAVDWLKVRKAKRAPLTETALDDLKREAEKAGITPVEAITICAKKNWQGFNSGWNWKDEQPSRRGTPQPENFDQRDYGKGVQDL